MTTLPCRSWLVVFYAVFAAAIGVSAAEQNIPEHRTGLRPQTPAEQEWERQNLIIASKVKLNALGMERVNAHRQARGLKPMAKPEVEVAALGSEVEGKTAAAGGAAQKPVAMAAAPANFPDHVDNSTLKYFPPIGCQPVSDCGVWATIYYCFTHMSAMAQDVDVKNGGAGNKNYIYSTKFVYNLRNGGVDAGVNLDTAWQTIQNFGCPTEAVWPSDNNYLGWPLTAEIWLNALQNRRVDTWGYVTGLNTPDGLTQVKTLLTDGYVLAIKTHIFSWQTMKISKDPSTSAADAYVGQDCVYASNGTEGFHAMTIVGYNDNVWIDLNGNGVVDPGEKGAFRIANQWGAGWADGGFTWISYDALNGVSAVQGAPPPISGIPVFNSAYWITVKPAYNPKAVAEVTVNSADRGNVGYSLGISSATTTTPATTWCPFAFSGGDYAFDGSTAACDATFVFDFTDIAPAPGQNARWYAMVSYFSSSNPATVKGYKVVDCGSGAETVCTNGVPATLSTSQNFWVDTSYGGGAAPPAVTTQPVCGTVVAGAAATFTVAASGTPAPTYQWQVRANGGAWTNVSTGSGGTTAGYTTAATALGNSGNQYQCVASNSAGTVTSNPATLTVVLAGDADHDGAFSMADLNVLVDWLLVRTAPPVSGSQTFTSCDVNGDGKIDMADINLYVDRLLGRITRFPVEP